MPERHLPGAEWVEEGLTDLSAGRETAAACLVSIGAPRLMDLGIAFPAEPLPDAEHRLYRILALEGADAAHGRYNALIRRLVSYERALSCAR